MTSRTTFTLIRKKTIKMLDFLKETLIPFQIWNTSPNRKNHKQAMKSNLKVKMIITLIFHKQ